MDQIELWKSYRNTGDMDARDALLLRHIQLVHHVARKVMKSGWNEGDFDDLVSAGTIGLIKAIENFDIERGLAFSTFATHRIRGAILDDLRKRDHAPRSVRRKQRELSRAVERLQGENTRQPSDSEIAGEIGVDLKELWRWQREAQRGTMVSIDRPLDPSDSRSPTGGELMADEEQDDVEEELLRTEELRLVRDEILKLKEQERTVLALYYYEELKLHEIARILGVTESRISQIRSAAVKNLRSRLAHYRTDRSA